MGLTNSCFVPSARSTLRKMEVKSNRKNSRSGGSSNAKHVYVPKHSAQKKTPPVFTVPVEQTDEPLNRAIHQCNDLIVLQGKLLEDSVQHQRAASELTRNEFNEIRRQLEVSLCCYAVLSTSTVDL